MAVLQEKNKKKWTKDGRSWYFTYIYIDENGNKRRSSSKLFESKAVAKKEEALHLLKETPSKKCRIFDIVAESYFRELSKTRKSSTIYSYKKDYKNHILPFFGKMNIYTIDIAIVRKWAEKMQKKALTTKYLNKIYSILKNIFDFAIRYYDLAQNPVKMFGRFKTEARERVVIKNKLRYLTKEDFDSLIKIVDSDLYKMFFIFLYYNRN